MLRVGEECVVTFPNFGHWRCRMQLGLAGHMPVSTHLPHNWHNTPNIHLCTTQDFEQLCQEEDLRIIQRRVVNTQYRENWSITLAPNLFASHAFYRLGRPA
jgi:methionine biosynthesis protein MetW